MIPISVNVNTSSGAALDGDTRGGDSGINFGNFSVGAGSSAASATGVNQNYIIAAIAAVVLLLIVRFRR